MNDFLITLYKSSFRRKDTILSGSLSDSDDAGETDEEYGACCDLGVIVVMVGVVREMAKIVMILTVTIVMAVVVVQPAT